MNTRTKYEMTNADLDKLFEACKPTMAICGSGGVPLFGTPQENANRAWAELGQRMGFDPLTVQPTGTGDKFFTAILISASPPNDQPLAEATSDTGGASEAPVSEEASDAKLAELILYMDDPNFDEDKLKFLLFKIDMEAFVKFGETITGATYIKEDDSGASAEARDAAHSFTKEVRLDDGEEDYLARFLTAFAKRANDSAIAELRRELGILRKQLDEQIAQTADACTGRDVARRENAELHAQLERLNQAYAQAWSECDTALEKAGIVMDEYPHKLVVQGIEELRARIESAERQLEFQRKRNDDNVSDWGAAVAEAQQQRDALQSTVDALNRELDELKGQVVPLGSWQETLRDRDQALSDLAAFVAHEDLKAARAQLAQAEAERDQKERQLRLVGYYGVNGDEVRSELAKLDALKAALEEAESVFLRYASMHTERGKTDKAEANRAEAVKCRNALAL